VTHAAKKMTGGLHARVLFAVVACAAVVSPSFAQSPAPLPESLRVAAKQPQSTQQASPVLSSATDHENRPLGGRTASKQSASESQQVVEPVTSASSYFRTIIALAAVLALIAVVAAIVKFAGKRSGGLFAALAPAAKAPQGVLEILARYPVTTGTQLVVIKFDRRVLLVSQTANKGWRGGATLATLCELTDASDVASILIKTRGEEQASLAVKFQKMLATEDTEFDKPADRNPYAIRPQIKPVSAPGARLDVVASDASNADPKSPKQTAAAIRQRLAAMQSSSRRAGGAA
jgi:hypothetical protein